MATAFGYVEREADSYVNWADVGRNMSATIDNIQRVRDEKKALIEKAYNEDLDFIKANPSGENKSLREKSIEYANSAAENLKLKYNLLKQGKSSVNDFVKFRQNLTDDTESLYGTLNKMQEEYKRKMDRAKAGESQYLERRNMELLEQYDLSKTDLFVNPLTGTVTIGLMEEVEENGQKIRRLTKDPNKFISVNEYKAAVNEDYNNYDPLPALAGWVEQHGEVIESLRTLGSELQAGSILEVTDITGNVLKQKMEALGKTPQEIAVAQKAIDDWNAAKTAFYKSELANGYNFLAILTDQKKFAPNGKQYIPTYNKDDLKKGKEYVYIERNNVGGSVPTFEKHHEEDALEYLDLLTRPLLDRKVKMSTYTEVGAQKQQPQILPEYYFSRGDKVKAATTAADYIGKLYSMNYEDRAQTLNTLRASKNVENIHFVESPDGKKKSIFILTTPETGSKQTIVDLTDDKGNPIALENIAETIAEYVYPDEIRNNLDNFRKALNPYKKYNPDWATDKKERRKTEDWTGLTAPKKDPFDIYEKNYSSKLGTVDKEQKTLFQKPQDIAAKELSEILKGTGVTVTPTGSNIMGIQNNYLKVSHPSAKDDFEFSVNEYKGNASKNQTELDKWLKKLFKN